MMRFWLKNAFLGESYPHQQKKTNFKSFFLIFTALYGNLHNIDYFGTLL